MLILLWNCDCLPDHRICPIPNLMRNLVVPTNRQLIQRCLWWQRTTGAAAGVRFPRMCPVLRMILDRMSVNASPSTRTHIRQAKSATLASAHRAHRRCLSSVGNLWMHSIRHKHAIDRVPCRLERCFEPRIYSDRFPLRCALRLMLSSAANRATIHSSQQ